MGGSDMAARLPIPAMHSSHTEHGGTSESGEFFFSVVLLLNLMGNSKYF